MKITNSVFGSLVATALAIAPIAAEATPLRAPSGVSETEDLAGEPIVLYLALAAAAAALIFLLLDEDSFDNVDDLPASP